MLLLAIQPCSRFEHFGAAIHSYEPICNGGRDGNPRIRTLVRSDDQVNPENDRTDPENEADEPEYRPKEERGYITEDERRPQYTHQEGRDKNPAENHDTLGSMKPDRLVLRFDEIHDDAREEPEHVREGCSDVLVEPGLGRLILCGL